MALVVLSNFESPFSRVRSLEFHRSLSRLTGKKEDVAIVVRLGDVNCFLSLFFHGCVPNPYKIVIHILQSLSRVTGSTLGGHRRWSFSQCPVRSGEARLVTTNERSDVCNDGDWLRWRSMATDSSFTVDTCNVRNRSNYAEQLPLIINLLSN